MSKNFFIVVVSIILAFLQSSLYINSIKINFVFLFFIYLLFFYDINYGLLSIFSGGVVMDLFSMNFGGYFFGLFITGIILYYIYRNVLSGDRFFTWISLSLIGVISFNSFFYLFSIFIKIFK